MAKRVSACAPRSERVGALAIDCRRRARHPDRGSAIPDPAVAGAVAVAAAIGVMFVLRCLHPPGGAAALLAVLTQASTLEFALFPVLVNSVLLVAVGIVYNTATGRRYPHNQVVDRSNAPPRSRFSTADLDAVLQRYNQVLDVSANRSVAELMPLFSEGGHHHIPVNNRLVGIITQSDFVRALYGAAA